VDLGQDEDLAALRLPRRRRLRRQHQRGRHRGQAASRPQSSTPMEAVHAQGKGESSDEPWL
jgi:hypothetical protein